MTKSQTVELLQQQLPGFYSVDQVIKLINDIEDGVPADQVGELVKKIEADQIEELIQKVESAVERRIQRMDNDDLVEKDSAEFELYGNEIQLSHVDVNDGTIAEECGEVVRDVLTDFFKAPSE